MKLELDSNVRWLRFINALFIRRRVAWAIFGNNGMLPSHGNIQKRGKRLTVKADVSNEKLLAILNSKNICKITYEITSYFFNINYQSTTHRAKRKNFLDANVTHIYELQSICFEC